MNDQPTLTPPEYENANTEKWEQTVLESARQFVYPPTPDIAGAVRTRLNGASRRTHANRRTLRLVAAALLALMIATLAVPETRAFVLEVLRIGVVRIFFGEPTITLTPTPATATKGSPTHLPTRTPFMRMLDAADETTLADAQQQLGAPLLLPGYPPTLGEPDHVYAQKIGQGVIVTLLWMRDDDATQPDLLLQILDRNMVIDKYIPSGSAKERETTVNGQNALWLTGTHQLYIFGNDEQVTDTIDKNLLVWSEEPLTYRLESDLSLDEARKVAESLR